MNLEFFVANRRLTRKGMQTLAADTADCDSFTIDFDEEWEHLVKIVVLQNGEDTAQVIYTGKTPLPRQVCGRGALSLTCYGYRKLADTVAVIRTLPMVRPVPMVGSSRPEESQSQPYTPSAYEQMAALVKEARLAAQRADQVAERLLQLQEQGAFTGPAGPAGASATVQVETVRRGSPAKVENLGTERNALLRFTLPYGLSEEEKEELKQQIVGDMGTALAQILVLQNAYIGGEDT